MNKLKLIVSDFHLGRGKFLPSGQLNVLEDFIHDDRFQQFMAYHMAENYHDVEIELIFNGDMLNLIQTDYHGHYPVIISESVSVAKMHAIVQGHPTFFETLREFLANPLHSITYVVGNHDQEMLWMGTRKVFEEAVGKEIQWKNNYYQVDGLYIEHGHQYEAVNRVDPARPFLTEGLPEPILNLPWGTLFTIQFITKIKAQRPVIDKVRPFRLLIWWSFFNDTRWAIVNAIRLISYFVATRLSRNRYRQTSLQTTLKIITELSVFPDLSDAARRILRTPDIHTVIFGHTHVYKNVQIADGKQYLNTGTWNDIVSLELDSFGRRTKLTYVKVEYTENGKAMPFLRHWIGVIPLEDDALAS